MFGEWDMKNIVIMSQKGGVGKTALADEIAFSLERTNTSFVFYDLDPQRTALHDDHKDEEPQIAVVDTKPGVDEDTLDNVEDADFIVIPTKASIDDMVALKRTLKSVRQVHKPTLIVANMWNRFKNCKSYMKWLTDYLEDGEQVLTLNQSEWIPNSREAEVSVIQAAKRTKVRSQLQKILNTVRAGVGLEEES